MVRAAALEVGANETDESDEEDDTIDMIDPLGCEDSETFGEGFSLLLLHWNLTGWIYGPRSELVSTHRDPERRTCADRWYN